MHDTPRVQNRLDRCFTVLRMRRVALGGVLVLAALSAAAVARAVQYEGHAKPGVHVLGVDVGGLSRAEIGRELTAWERTPVTIRAGGRSFHVPRGWLVKVRVAPTTERALASGSLTLLVVPQRVDVRPVFQTAQSANGVLTELA